MCAGAILQARVGNVVYGARNPQLGAHGSWCGLLGTRDGEEDKVQTLKTHAIMPEVNVRADVLGEECSELMKTFFKNRREQAKKERRDCGWRRKNMRITLQVRRGQKERGNLDSLFMTIDISISSEYVYRNYILHTYVYCLLHICESNLVVVKVEILLVRIPVLANHHHPVYLKHYLMLEHCHCRVVCRHHHRHLPRRHRKNRLPLR